LRRSGSAFARRALRHDVFRLALHAVLADRLREQCAVATGALGGVVSDRLPAADVRGTIRSTAPDSLVSVREFDRYQGTSVPAGSVSLSFRLTFRDATRTMTDAEAQRAIDAVVAALVERHGAVRRGA
jgi:hypothetical protein